jgi:hypothetical protein
VPVNTGDVARVLANRPAPGEVVEVRGYTGYDLTGFSGPDSTMLGFNCPGSAGNYFADQPFPIGFSHGHLSGHENQLPTDEPWLLVVSRSYAHPQAYPGPAVKLPFRGVLRGQLDDPVFKSCEHADRIFVVSEVVEDEGVQPPTRWGDLTRPAPDDEIYEAAATWPRYAHQTLGVSIPLPPRWRVSDLPGGGVALSDPNHADIPIVIEVLPGERQLVDDKDLAYGGGCGRWGGGANGYHQRPIATPPGLDPLEGIQADSAGDNQHCLRVFLNDHGRTIRLSLDVPLGFDLPLTLPCVYTAIADNLTVSR